MLVKIIDLFTFRFHFVASISVDTLLQIHAIHNLLSVDTSIGPEERASFEAELSRLEAKYLEKYVNLVRNLQIEQSKWDDKIAVIRSKLVANEYQWWMNALQNEPHDSQHLLRRIQDEIKTSYGKQKGHDENGLNEIWIQ